MSLAALLLVSDRALTAPETPRQRLVVRRPLVVLTGAMAAPLIIDQVSASLQVSDADLRAWASGRRVFVSSLITDMPAERAAARSSIETLGATPVMFEDDLGAQDVAADRAYLAGVRSSDVYVGLFGERYGVRMPDGYSATHAEFLEAEKRGLRLCLFVSGEGTGEMDGSQRDLIASARNSYTTGSWTDPADLADRIGRRLRDIAAQELAPWVRVGRTVFRATQIDNDGHTITVAANVRSNTVHAELERLREFRASDVPFAAPHFARRVQVAGLTSRSLSVTTHHDTLSLTIQERQGTPMRYSMNDMSADEIARRTLADGLFGTSTLGETHFLPAAVDPLEPIRGLGLDDAIVRPVARLLVTEHLMTTEDASTLDAFVLGPERQGQRQLRVTWTPGRPFMDAQDPEPVTVAGAVRGI